MKIKKLCTLGVLDFNINLVLLNTQAKNLNFNIDSFKKIEDLKSLFFFEEDKNQISIENKNFINNSNKINGYNTNYLDNISLTSDNYLINTLLYINRAYKEKTFIEFIMPNQLDYNDNIKFVKKIIEYVLYKNYFFIVENRISNIISKIKFVIKIIDDKTKDIISSKSFDLFEKNELDVSKIEEGNKETENNISLNKLNYNFNKSDYFIIDLKEFKFLLLEYEKIYDFIFNIISNYPNIKIILIIDENINIQNSNEITSIKQLIDLSDVIFCFKNCMNNILKSFYSINKRKIFEKNPSKLFFISKNNNFLNHLDLITKDFCKLRKDIPRLSIIFQEFNIIYIYKQEFMNNSISYQSLFPLLINYNNDISNDKNNFIYSKSNKLFHIFIGGFLSTYFYNKSLYICFRVGKLLMEKTIDDFISKKDIFINQDNYIIEIKPKKNSSNEKIRKIRAKEKHFILDCTNKEKSQKREYNILTDNNCLGFLTKRYHSKNKPKLSFVDKIENFMKKKNKNKLNSNKIQKEKIESIIKNNENNFSKSKIKSLIPFVNINDNVEINNEKIFTKYLKAKTKSFDLNNDIHSKKNLFNNTSSIKKKNINNLIEKTLIKIHKTENYNKYLFDIYLPNKNYDDFIKENNKLNLKFSK